MAGQDRKWPGDPAGRDAGPKPAVVLGGSQGLRFTLGLLLMPG